MKIWLDDEKDARQDWFPVEDGWVHCRWPADIIEHLKTGTVTDVSLDHDLGEDSGYEHPRTGYDVIIWLETEVAHGRWTHPLPRFRLHTRNTVGKQRMAQGLRNIMRMMGE